MLSGPAATVMTYLRGASRIGAFDVWLAFGYALAIFVMGSLPSGPASTQLISDKVLHFVGFGLLAWLWCRALSKLRPGVALRWVLLGGFAVSVLIGGALELWQAVLSYRTCEFLDWVADALGAAVGAALCGGIMLASKTQTRTS